MIATNATVPQAGGGLISVPHTTYVADCSVSVASVSVDKTWLFARIAEVLAAERARIGESIVMMGANGALGLTQEQVRLLAAAIAGLPEASIAMMLK